MSELNCAARATTDPPQDCDWPFCGCDDHATKVVDALIEAGWLPLEKRPVPCFCGRTEGHALTCPRVNEKAEAERILKGGKPVSSLQAGEIIPQCGTTLQVYAARIGDITVGGKPLDGTEACVTEMEWVQPGLLRVTLALWCGHRLIVRHADAMAAESLPLCAICQWPESCHTPQLQADPSGACLRFTPSKAGDR